MYKALVGMPPDTLDGRFRVTEQGEMITQNFGHRAVAEATLDLYNAVCVAVCLSLSVCMCMCMCVWFVF